LRGAAACLLVAAAAIPTFVLSQPQQPFEPDDAGGLVNPFIGTSGGGNTFPGAVLPFGMLSWSPENTRGDATRAAAPGGYHYEATRIRGFSLTHLSGTGCRGASGDIPFMPHTGEVASSPSADVKNEIYASSFSHDRERAVPGWYQVGLDSGVHVELAAERRSGIGRFTFPANVPAVMLVRTSDTQIGSGHASIRIDPQARTVSGSVTSGNFCGYLHRVNRRDYYTLYFVAVFDRPFASTGTWKDSALSPGSTQSEGGTTYGSDGYPPPGRGSGGWVEMDLGQGNVVTVRVAISYVSVENARANLEAELPSGRTLDEVRLSGRREWHDQLRKIMVTGGTPAAGRIFYTALYHSLLHMNVASDVNGEYRGFDGKVYRVKAPQRAQYANFSGWDVYRTQVQLVALLDRQVAADMAQSLLNQAAQNKGVWDRWTHNTGDTHVMEGDPSAPTVASIAAFGATTFDMKGALESLVRAATVATPLDSSDEGCRIMCPGQRPSLDKWLSINYIPTVSNSWGGAGATLELATADFAISQLAQRLGRRDLERQFLARSDYWRNVFNTKPNVVPPQARGNTPPPQPAEAPMPGGYIQNRNEDGTWPPLTPSASAGFAEGSSVQYTWMVPFNVRGLFDAMGGDSPALARLNAFFRRPDGSWALRNAGGLHAQMSNEPSIGVPWLYHFAGRPDLTAEILHEVLASLWSEAPNGIPGNDDLGTMSAWYVWASIGLYPYYPGRAELLVTPPLFRRVTIMPRDGRTITIDATGTVAGVPHIASVVLNGRRTTRSWVPESFVRDGGALTLELSSAPDRKWGSARSDRPPSFTPSAR
jgi:predicted alpha-1,2-mannosidase